jgi:hypothetical protein
MDHLPSDLRTSWPELAYTQFSASNLSLLEGVLRILEFLELNIQHKQQVKNALSSMRVVVDTIATVEDQTNRVLHFLKNGDTLKEEEAVT